MPKKKIPYSKLYKNGRPGIPIMYYYLDNLRFNTANNENNTPPSLLHTTTSTSQRKHDKLNK